MPNASSVDSPPVHKSRLRRGAGAGACVNMQQHKRHKEVINLLGLVARWWLSSARVKGKDVTELHLAALRPRYGFRAVRTEMHPEGRHSARLSFWNGTGERKREKGGDKIVLTRND